MIYQCNTQSAFQSYFLGVHSFLSLTVIGKILDAQIYSLLKQRKVKKSSVLARAVEVLESIFRFSCDLALVKNKIHANHFNYRVSDQSMALLSVQFQSLALTTGWLGRIRFLMVPSSIPWHACR